MAAARSRTTLLNEGILIRVEVPPFWKGRGLFGPARNFRDSTVVRVLSVTHRRGVVAGAPYAVRVQHGNGDRLTAYFSGFQTHLLGEHRIVIDADCPKCRYPERWLDQQSHRFGCNHCTYTSTEREK